MKFGSAAEQYAFRSGRVRSMIVFENVMNHGEFDGSKNRQVSRNQTKEKIQALH
jgi:hypothetical protein